MSELDNKTPVIEHMIRPSTERAEELRGQLK
jgi:hypothetical protein